jgi:hypothetical protein
VVLDEPATIRDEKARIGKWITRYWTEFVVVAIAILLWAPRLSGPIDLRWDAGVYYVLGTSLATGHGYRILSEPGSPEALQYPPLLSVVVALYQRALGSADPAVVARWLRISYAAIFLAYALAVLALARRRLRPWFALTAATLCLLQCMTIFLSDLLFAELPVALIGVVFALVAADGWLAPRPWLRETASFALAAAGFLLRTAAVALLAAWVIEALARRRWRLAVARGVLALLPVIAWETYVYKVHRSYDYTHPSYEYQRALYQNYNVTYAENISLLEPFRPERGLADWHGLATRLVTNFANMPVALGEAVSTTYGYWRNFLQDAQYHLLRVAVVPTPVTWIPLFGLGGLVLGGFVVFILRRDWVLASIVLISITLICLTPWPEQVKRYLMPIAPFLTIAAVLASEQVVRLAQRWGRTSTLIPVVLVGLLLLTLTAQTYVAFKLFHSRGAPFAAVERDNAKFRFFYHDHSWRAWEEAAAWIGARALPGETVATTAPHQFYLQTGLHAVYPPMDADPVRVRRLLAAVPVSYVIIDEFHYRDFSRRYALPAVKGDPLGWRLVHSVNRTQIYESTTSGK